MSKAVLISIRPEWCEKIINAQKTIEVRKTRPKLDTPFKCYIYMTKGNPYVSRLRHNGELGHAIEIENWVGTVIGEFVCDGIETIGIPYPAYQKEMRQDVIDRSCLSYAELHRYAMHRSLYGWHISDLVIYDKPLDICTFRKWCKEECELCVLDYTRCSNSIPLERPPQSWCYVQERFLENEILKAKIASNEWANNACLIDNKSRYYREHCLDDNGRCCKHIKPSPEDKLGDECTMSCELGEEKCPYVEES